GCVLVAPGLSPGRPPARRTVRLTYCPPPRVCCHGQRISIEAAVNTTGPLIAWRRSMCIPEMRLTDARGRIMHDAAEKRGENAIDGVARSGGVARGSRSTRRRQLAARCLAAKEDLVADRMGAPARHAALAATAWRPDRRPAAEVDPERQRSGAFEDR